MKIAGLVSGLAMLGLASGVLAQSAPPPAASAEARPAEVDVKALQRKISLVNREIEEAYAEYRQGIVNSAYAARGLPANGGREESLNPRPVRAPKNVGTLTPRLAQLVSERTLLEAQLKEAKELAAASMESTSQSSAQRAERALTPG